jgi:hypothetical protein
VNLIHPDSCLAQSSYTFCGHVIHYQKPSIRISVLISLLKLAPTTYRCPLAVPRLHTCFQWGHSYKKPTLPELYKQTSSRMRSLLPLLSSLSLTLALDFVSTDTGFFTYSPSAWNLYDLLPNASGCSGKTEFGPDGPASFTFTFPQFSTSFEWWGVKSTGGGKVTVCFDGATGATCDTVDYFDPNFVLGATPPIRLYRKTGLSNTAHTVVITNIADSAHGNLFGQISMDKVVIDGTVPAPPIFPSNTFLTSIPLINGAVLVDPLLGSGPAGIRGK